LKIAAPSVGCAAFAQNEDIFLDSYDLVSGNSLDGVYQFQFYFSQYSYQGTWTVSGSLDDAANNQLTVDSSYFSGKGFQDSVTQTGVGDVTPPTIVNFQICPNEIDVSSEAGIINITVTITDDLSGFAQLAVFSFAPGYGANPVEANQAGAFVFVSNRISGTDLNGVYNVIISVPVGSQTGVWTFWNPVVTESEFVGWTGAVVQDNVGNELWIDECDFANDPGLWSITGYAQNFTVSTSSSTGTCPVLMGSSYGPVCSGNTQCQNSVSGIGTGLFTTTHSDASQLLANTQHGVVRFLMVVLLLFLLGNCNF